jgi:hypothetical protein
MAKSSSIPPTYADLDVVRDLGCTHTPGATGNAARLNAAMLKQANKYPFGIPAGYLPLDASWVIPGRTSYRIRGNGKAWLYGDNQNTDGGSSLSNIGPASRLVWEGGNATDPMLDYFSLGCVIEGIVFQGRPLPTIGGGGVGDKARCGILVHPQVNLPTGKLHVRDCTFYETQDGIVCGTLDAPDENGDYATSGAPNADHCMFDNLNFFYPNDDNSGGEPRSCIRFRSDQSVDFVLRKISVNGNPDNIIYVERGGRIFAEGVSLSTAGSAANPSTLLRLGKVNEAAGHIEMSFWVDQICAHFRLLDMDHHYGQITVYLTGVIASDTYDPSTNGPIIVAKGPCKIVVDRVIGLQPQSIQLIGDPGGGAARKGIAEVVVNECELNWRCAAGGIASLIHPSSSGSYRLRSANCSLDGFGPVNTSGYNHLPIANIDPIDNEMPADFTP